ncbi:hypothetical protein OFEAOIEE_LOCUS3641 [Methylorubrum extorquens]
MNLHVRCEGYTPIRQTGDKYAGWRWLDVITSRDGGGR